MKEQYQILIVDDESFNIKVLTDLLRSDYKIMAAKNGEKALQVFQGERIPDIVLLDIMMPGIDGYEVCRQLKKNDLSKNIPVIFITALNDVDDETKGFELGAVDYITKPFKPPVVKARVKTHLMLKRKNDLLEKLVSLDGLTEIPNRRCFDETLTMDWETAEQNNKQISLVMMDIDFFKKFNDHYGHAAGDTCLREVAFAIKNALKRPGDFAARYGGEEFVAILPQTDLTEAMEIAEAIRQSVEDCSLSHEYSDAASYVSLSLGVATMVPESTKNTKSLIEAADACLYQAKEKGRNRIYGSEGQSNG